MNASSLFDDGFAAFWAVYPRKVKRDYAEKCWRKLAPNEALQAVILASVEAHRAEWTSRRFTPHASTFLNQRQWTDEVAPAVDDSPIPDRVRKQAEDMRRLWIHCRHEVPCDGYAACVTLIARRLLAQGRAQTED